MECFSCVCSKAACDCCVLKYITLAAKAVFLFHDFFPHFFMKSIFSESTELTVVTMLLQWHHFGAVSFAIVRNSSFLSLIIAVSYFEDCVLRWSLSSQVIKDVLFQNINYYKNDLFLVKHKL